MMYLFKKKKSEFNEILIPSGVTNIFEKQVKVKTEDDFEIPFFPEAVSLEDIIGKHNVFEGNSSFNQMLKIFFERGNAYSFDEKNFIPENIEVINSAIELAENGRKVSVASGNKELLNTLQSYKEINNLDIKLISPYSNEFMLDFIKNSNIRYFVTSNVLSTLKSMKEDSNYVGVNVALGEDLAFSSIDLNKKFSIIYDAANGRVCTSLGRALPVNFMLDEGINLSRTSQAHFLRKVLINYYINEASKLEIVEMKANAVTIVNQLNKLNPMTKAYDKVSKKLEKAFQPFTAARISEESLVRYGHIYNKINSRRQVA
ncbi:MAG: hypothetical protein KC550_06420 [Nanoarchaeota archaeon]|nr:hypothetical protein [Nanoarchaeota archaeon]